MPSRWRRVDVVVVALIVGLMLAVGIPYLGQSREAERRRLCEFRMSNLARAVLVFDQSHNRFPGYRDPAGRDEDEAEVTSWVSSVMPLLGGDNSPVSAPQLEPSNNGFPTPADEQEYIPALVCPDDASAIRQGQAAALSFVANCGLPDARASESAPADWPADWPANGVFLDRVRVFPGDEPQETSLAYVEAHDGSEETLLLSENVDAGNWTESTEAEVGFVWVAHLDDDGRATPGDSLLPINAEIGSGDSTIKFARPSSGHPGGVNAAYCDGHVAFLAQEIDYLVFTQLMTPDGTAIKFAGTDMPIGAPYRESAETLEP